MADAAPLGRHLQPTTRQYFSLHVAQADARDRYTWWADDERPCSAVRGFVDVLMFCCFRCSSPLIGFEDASPNGYQGRRVCSTACI